MTPPQPPAGREVPTLKELVNDLHHARGWIAHSDAIHDLRARLSPDVALKCYEALEGVLRVADRNTVEFDAVRHALALLDGRKEAAP